jgi:hypothetical protein
VAGLAAATWLATMFNPPALIAVLGVPTLTVLSALTGFLPAALMLAATVKQGRSSFLKKRTKKLLWL